MSRTISRAEFDDLFQKFSDRKAYAVATISKDAATLSTVLGGSVVLQSSNSLIYISLTPSITFVVDPAALRLNITIHQRPLHRSRIMRPDSIMA